jgi:two-component system sensor histidine kinase BaeS
LKHINTNPPAAVPRARVWIAATLLATGASALLYDAGPGLNWLLATGAIAIGLIAIERPGRAALRSRRYAAAGLAVALSAAIVVTADRAVQGLLVLAIGGLGSVVARLGGGLAPEDLGPAQLAATPWRAARLTAAQSSRVVGDGVRALGSGRSIAPLRGTAFAVVIIVVFGGLLGEADPTLAAVRGALADVVTSLAGLGRAAFFTVTACGLLGFLSIAPEAGPRRSGATAAGAGPAVHTDAERLIVLGAVATLFATFLVLQLSYLFQNPGARVGSGVTLAEAVHRGFVEISLVVSLTSAILLVLDRRAARGPRDAWVRWTGYLVIAECLLLLASAALRLGAYEAAYGYTMFRVYVRLYLAFLGVTLLLLAGELRAGVRPARVCWRVGVAGLAMLFALAIGNPAAWIVRASVARYLATGRMDWDALATTRADGLPELVRSLPRLAPPDRQRLRAAMRDGAACRTDAGQSVPEAWFEWNLRRAAAREACGQLQHAVP